MHGLHVSQATSAADIEKPQNSCDQCRLRKKKCVLQPPHERHCTRCSRLGSNKRKRRAFERQPVVSRVGVMQGVSQWVVSASNNSCQNKLSPVKFFLSQNGFSATTPAFPRRNLGPGGEDLGIVSEPPLQQEPISSNVLPPPWNSIRYSYPLESSNSSTSSFRQITKYPTPATPTHRNEAYQYSYWTTGPKAQPPILQRLINHVPPAHSPVSQFILTGNELPSISGMLGTVIRLTKVPKTSESLISTNRLPGGGISLMDLMN
ncbi:hypothetical protein BCR33DRAFT_720687 [Rhizoclosmatium globosum]|uniref:Zn(2)-C6 fungal-type domain-containing protein n=1 Tax=Rhizoclosmatium globosum TaxID=329046 RepID=A0A1Y2BVA8_9FUNG|nr:hypothetical protein BCR33DRAFT_720687 [Rhizoclosmatium globosum]|eukprot:ORY38700.1 hypothetical protein BCR33DRAFT_720687 [Rhizoclosmatium globosum]